MTKKSISVAITLLLPFTLMAGCHSDGAEGGVDMAYIHTPNLEAEKRPVVNEPITLLFPTGKERLWTSNVTAQNQRFTETVRVDTPRTIGGIPSATTLTMSKNGKQYRSEIYQVKSDTLSLVAAGSEDKMIMSPPMLLIRTKAPEGEEYKWEGEITFQKAKAPAQAYSRVHAPQEITTPAGKFNAYRVDTTLTTIIEGRAVVFPAARWFAPGVGIVKQNFRIGNTVVSKELISYKGG